MNDLTDATSRLLTWIEAERRAGYPDDLGPQGREALANDIQVLIDNIDVTTPPVKPIEVDPVTGTQFVYVVWAMAIKPQVVAVCTSEDEAAKHKSAVSTNDTIFHIEKIPLDANLIRHDLSTVVYQRVSTSE